MLYSILPLTASMSRLTFLPAPWCRYSGDGGSSDGLQVFNALLKSKGLCVLASSVSTLPFPMDASKHLSVFWTGMVPSSVKFLGEGIWSRIDLSIILSTTSDGCVDVPQSNGDIVASIDDCFRSRPMPLASGNGSPASFLGNRRDSRLSGSSRLFQRIPADLRSVTKPFLPPAGFRPRQKGVYQSIRRSPKQLLHDIGFLLPSVLMNTEVDVIRLNAWRALLGNRTVQTNILALVSRKTGSHVFCICMRRSVGSPSLVGRPPSASAIASPFGAA